MTNLVRAALMAPILTINVANAATLDFQYNIPTQREDNTSLATASISRCNLFNVTVTPHVKVADLPMTGKHSYNLVSTGNTQRFAMKCFDTAGIESNYSNAIEITTKMQNATNIQVTIKTTVAGKL